ncbi:hypothetical protein [Frankia sp. EI5c]|uniref:hypothetical protein n=1 Tax=Frankia sp. EI5c TaxID=683316 RepID=UPI001F5BDE5C|nr:hypothetical protein [Frankia sp. EI5c]
MTTTTTRTRPWATPATRIAVIVAEIAAPAVLVTALLVLISWHEAPDLAHGLLWGAVSVLFGTAIPMAFVLYGVRRRRWSDHHVPERSKRMAPMLFGCASVGAGCILLLAFDAPKNLVTVYVTIIVEALVLTGITRFWKISGHVAAAASCATVAMFLFGRSFALCWLLVPVVAWARVQTRNARLAQGPAEDHDEIDGHTPAQTLAGAAVAAVTVATACLLAGTR